jgi:hypothetical protein
MYIPSSLKIAIKNLTLATNQTLELMMNIIYILE